jgi:hypothetical protein
LYIAIAIAAVLLSRSVLLVDIRLCRLRRAERGETRHLQIPWSPLLLLLLLPALAMRWLARSMRWNLPNGRTGE